MSEEEKKDFESGQKDEIAPQVDPKQQAKEAKAAKKAVKPQWYVKLIGILAPIASFVLSILAGVKAAEKGGQTIAIVLFAIAVVLALGSGLICMILPTKKKKRKFIFGFVISMIALSMTLYPLTMIISNSTKGGSGGTSETSQKGGSGSSGTSTSEKGGSSSEGDTSIDESLIYTYKLNGSTYEITGLTSVGHQVKTLVVPATHDGKTVNKIGARAFRVSSTGDKIEKIILPSSITTLDKQAFYMTNAKSIELDGTFTEIPDECFRYSSKLESITFATGMTVTSIGEYAFSETGLSSFNFSGVETVGDYAFQKCSKLATITMDNHLKSFGRYAFGNCTELKTINFGQYAPSFGYGVFDGCTKLPLYTEDNIKYLGSSTNKYMVLFNGENYADYNLVIPSGCQTIYPYAFGSYSGSEYSGNTHIRYLTLPSTLRIIGTHAFDYCEYLQSVTIDGLSVNLKEIHLGAFYHTNLSNFILPEGLVVLGDAFRFTPLSSINIPSTVTEFSPEMFIQMDELETITVSTSHPSYSTRDNYLYDKAGTKLIRIPIGALEGAVNIPSGTTTIGTWGVLYPNVNTTVNIPLSVTKIEARAIQDSINTATAGDKRHFVGVTYEGTVSQWNAIDKATNWCDANNGSGKGAMKFNKVTCSDGVVDL